MSEDLLRTVKKLLASGRGDANRLRDIINTIKEGAPLVMSDYRYVDDLASKDATTPPEDKDIPRPQVQPTIDESIEILRVRLAEGKITVAEFKELKKALTD